MTKPVKKAPETVAEFLARGGKITKVKKIAGSPEPKVVKAKAGKPKGEGITRARREAAKYEAKLAERVHFARLIAA